MESALVYIFVRKKGTVNVVKCESEDLTANNQKHMNKGCFYYTTTLPNTLSGKWRKVRSIIL